MRRHLFEIIDAGGGEGLDELVITASATIRRPAEAAA
jgi:hypothetical protein